MPTASNSPPTLPVYQQIASNIEHMIESGRYAPGQRLPSIRELCELYSVADLTVKRALRRLADRGLTESVTGSGTFVRSKASASSSEGRATSAAGLVLLGPPPRPIYMHQINLIQNKLLQLGHSMFYGSIESDEQLPQMRRHLAQAGAGCLVIMPNQGQSTTLPGGDLLRRAPLPTLVLECTSDEHPFVRADIEHASQLLVRHLYELGHRRIALATRYHLKISGVQHAVAQLKDPNLQILYAQASVDSHREMMQAAQDILAARPTAVIACNDLMADVMIEQFALHGLTVPDGMSIASYDDDPHWSYRSRVPMTAVRHPCELIADEVAHWVHARLTTTSRSNRRFQRVVTGSLIVRESTAAIC